MQVRWSGKAKTELENTLDFWSENNKSDLLRAIFFVHNDRHYFPL